MDNRWIEYWKKCLLDASRIDVDWNRLENFETIDFDIFQEHIPDVENVNRLIDKYEERINRQKNISNRDDPEWVSINEAHIQIAPFCLQPLPEHQQFISQRNIIYPYWYNAIVNRDCRLSIPEETTPIIPRRFLTPVADDRVDLVLASVDTMDDAIAVNARDYDNYQDYVNQVEAFFAQLTGINMQAFSPLGYELLNNGRVVLPEDEITAASAIINLYEKINNCSENLPLLSRIIDLNHDKEIAPLDVSDFAAYNDMHIGQMNYKFPISISQRKALYTLLSKDNRVFAVNGPPGTGKTTLLQSVVANEMVRSVVENGGTNPPMILACSANNQAVTNIIESFSKSGTRTGQLEGRWLPNLEGYATFLPSAMQVTKGNAPYNYCTLNGAGIFSDVENMEYIRHAEKYYIEKALTYLGGRGLTTTLAVQKLKEKILTIKSVINNGSESWKRYLETENLFEQHFLLKTQLLQDFREDGLLDEKKIQTEISNLQNKEKEVVAYFREEPFLRKLGCFFKIKPSLANRRMELNIILRNNLDIDRLIYKLNHILGLLAKRITIAQEVLRDIGEWKKWKLSNRITGNPPRNEEQYWDCEYYKLQNEDIPANCFYDELDIGLRHEAFQLAVHYWEGMWLSEIKEAIQVEGWRYRKGLDITQRRWRLRSMLTPCFVSTFYMAPKFFCYAKHIAKNKDGNPIFDNPPLYNFIDLLIIDEAGQVPPEVGVATFALARKALVVGDVKQIEPVWSISDKISTGNLKKASLVESYDDFTTHDFYESKGFLASSGSIMRMAQGACDYKEEGIREKGVLLTEHRRCYDETIGYCNEVAYGGLLKPLKGRAPGNNLFPPMYCIHVEANSEYINSIRYNIKEAESIADWLAKNKERIENRYIDGKEYKCIEDIVGILTPFVGQKYKLRSALKRKGFNVAKLKMGTVHALQGAERPIVIFSMTYGEGDVATMFFDRDNKPNILNVAVSRAKNSFIVFANTKIFDRKANTPSGILAKYLEYENS